MIRPDYTTIKIVNHVLDLFICLVAFTLAWQMRLHLTDPVYGQTIGSYGSLFFIYYLVNQFVLLYNSAYRTARMRTFTEQSWIYFKSVYTSLIIIMAIAYTIQPIQSSRMILVFATSGAFLLLLAKEKIMRMSLVRIRASGHNIKKVLLIARTDQQVMEVHRNVESSPLLGLRIEGVVALDGTLSGQAGGCRVLGNATQVVELIETTVLDAVIFLEPIGSAEWVKDMIWECERRGMEVWVKLDITANQISQVAVQHLGTAPFLTMRSGPTDMAAILVKYALDRIAALVLLAVLAPVMLAIGLAIKLTSPGPVFFRQHRATVNGRRFVCLKFRSMVDNAEAIKESLRNRNEMKGPAFKMKHDPRITPLGRFLRKSSLDELPQLINVLFGDMSLVGPRPLCVSEAARIHGWARRRLSMKPGITCIWQVTKRNQVKDFEEWAEMDLQYIDHWSLWLDMTLLLKTLPVVLKGTGM